MSAEIIELSAHRKPARPVVLPSGFTLTANTLEHGADEPFHFTSPVRPGQPLEAFTDEELCELHDWIFGKVMREP